MTGSSLWGRPALSLRSIAAAAGALLWLGLTALTVANQIDNPTKPGIALAALLVIAPVAALNFLRVPVYLLALYGALLPFNSLLVTGTGATVGKYVGIAVAGSTLLALFVLRRTVPPARSMAVVFALMLYAGLTIFWAIDADFGFRGYMKVLSFVLLYIVIALYPARLRDLEFIIAVAVAGAVAAAAYGGYLYVHGHQVFGPRLYIGINADESIDPNDYAATLIAPIAITLTMFMQSRSLVRKLGFLSILVVLFSGFVLSGSRGGLVAFAAVAIFLLWRSAQKRQLLAMLLAAGAAVIGSPIGRRLMNPDVVTGDGRTELWKVGLASLHQYWLGGAGVGNFQLAFNQYYLATWHMMPGWSRAAHSIFIQSAVEYGITGFILVIVLWYMMFRELRDIEKDSILGGIGLALRASVVGLFAAGFSLDVLLFKYTWFTFSLVALTRAVYLARRDPS